VFSVATLHLHATADAVEHEWRRALAAGGIVELGLGRATPRELVEAAATAVESGERTRLGPIGERLVIDAVAEGAGGALTAINALASLAPKIVLLVIVLMAICPIGLMGLAERAAGALTRLRAARATPAGTSGTETALP